MPITPGGSGAANNPAITTGLGQVGPSLSAEKMAQIAAAARAVQKAEAQLATALQALAEAKKGMN